MYEPFYLITNEQIGMQYGNNLQSTAFSALESFSSFYQNVLHQELIQLIYPSLLN